MLKGAPKTLIVGAAGNIGRVLYQAYRSVHPDLLGTDWKGRDGLLPLSLEDPRPPLDLLKRSGYTWAVVCAGIRDFVTCEHQKSFTRQRNVDGTLALARRLGEAGLRTVFLSTDAVFDGATGDYTEESPVGPVNEYARQKVDVEQRLPEATGGRFLILRIGRVIGLTKGDGTFLDGVAARLAAGQPVDAAYDQIFNPTVAEDFPRVLAALQAADATGIVHVGCAEPASRYDIVTRLAQALGVDAGLVRRMSLDDIRDDVPRPKNSGMRTDRLQKMLTFRLRTLDDCIAAVAANYSERVHDR